MKHVQNETRTRVQLKGHGSGYLENDTGHESDEPLYINIMYVLEIYGCVFSLELGSDVLLYS